MEIFVQEEAKYKKSNYLREYEVSNETGGYGKNHDTCA